MSDLGGEVCRVKLKARMEGKERGTQPPIDMGCRGKIVIGSLNGPPKDPLLSTNQSGE